MSNNKMPPKILIIEPEKTLYTYICNKIERSGFDIARYTTIEAVLAISASILPNIIMISSEIKAPSIELVNEIRKAKKLNNVPIIFLIDNDEANIAYNFGNNNLIEVVYRPFDAHQIMSMIKTLLRSSQPVFQNKILKYKDISIDLVLYKVVWRNKPIRVGPIEFKILHLLMMSPTTVHSRKYIINYVWGADKEVELRTIDVHINRLRSAIKSGGEDVPLIQTIRSGGYCLDLSTKLY